MNLKTWTPLILAIVLGGIAAKVAHDTLLKNKAPAQPTGNYAKVIVAKADIQPGTQLTADQLSISSVEADKVPTNSFSDASQLTGRVAQIAMVKNQVVIEPMLAPTGSGSGLQALVPPGMRAITVEVNEYSGLAGMLVPGCHVDILATIQGGQNGQVAKTIVQNVTVSAVGQRTAAAAADPSQPPPQPGEAKSVTILCNPADAEAVELACATGRPCLVLRGGRDHAIVATAGISVAQLRGDSDTKDQAVASAKPVTAATQPSAIETPSVAVNVPPHRTIKIFRAGQESTVTMNILDGEPANAVGSTPQTDPFH